MRVYCSILLIAAALLPLPVAAMDAAGFYAGIYAAGGMRNDADFQHSIAASAILDSDVAPTPPVTNPGFESLPFDLFAEGMSNYPNATIANFAGSLLEGTLTSGLGGGAGVVVGYALGDGIRIEADMSAMSFAAQTVNFTSYYEAEAGTAFDNGVWEWVVLDEDTTSGTSSYDFGMLPPGGDMRTTAAFLLANAYVDFETGTALRPYLGAGVGVAYLSSRYDCGCSIGYTVDSTALVPAAQIGGGMRMALNKQVTLDIGYRYKLAASAEVTSAFVIPNISDSDTFFAVGHRQSGLLGIQSIQAGLTFALP